MVRTFKPWEMTNVDCDETVLLVPTVNVYKINNIKSGTGYFVLESLSVH